MSCRILVSSNPANLTTALSMMVIVDPCDTDWKVGEVVTEEAFNEKNIAVMSATPGARGAMAHMEVTATVEAEYGDAVVEGNLLTMAHHGPRKGQKCPCSYSNDCVGELQEALYGEDLRDAESVGLIGLSHVDLDTLGGIAAILGKKKSFKGFWEAAEFVDVNGAHKLAGFGPSVEVMDRLNAFWAWSQDHRTYPPRDGSVLDVTEQVMAALTAIEEILGGDERLIEDGRIFAAQEAALNTASYASTLDGGTAGRVITRKSGSFVNHLYTTPVTGQPAAAVVAFDPAKGTVTVSLADPIPGVSCRAIVQGLWGSLAGGHDGIAGGPRDVVLTEADWMKAADAMASAVWSNS